MNMLKSIKDIARNAIAQTYAGQARFKERGDSVLNVKLGTETYEVRITHVNSDLRRVRIMVEEAQSDYRIIKMERDDQSWSVTDIIAFDDLKDLTGHVLGEIEVAPSNHFDEIRIVGTNGASLEIKDHFKENMGSIAVMIKTMLG